ncbi:Mannose-6-phosphate isomerase [Salmonella enterica subsp. enterica serovar Adelaide str. A4-669]|uniref:mannose-6-phosphate isomerase n=1 Tax=Salmonella enterica subsp. enterica serovar Adelaide str. A4-669 TaxID=913063 RepID=A0A6C8GM57_SALET|nr:Mannose-6-phosphate isomerase [Salmonella enterica subsp. enterica serovar Adelaide str. A4-669]
MQNYAWGSKTALTELYGIANPQQQPMAELWMGAHPKSSSRITTANGETVSLRDAIEKNKTAMLGEAVANRFGELPFLFKVLCAAQPLSIQVHPNAQPLSIQVHCTRISATPKSVSRKKMRRVSPWMPQSGTIKILTINQSWFLL